MCQTCWDKERPHDQPPADRAVGIWNTETCCMCGKKTTDGIHVIRNPTAVPYPTTD